VDADGYIRVSRVGGRSGDSYITKKEQRKQIEAYAATHGMKVVRWHEDEDQSGSTTDRHGLQKALARCRAGETGGIIAARLDRLARSVIGAADLIKRSTEEGWRVIAVDLGLDPKTANGRLVMQILVAVAEWELARRTEDWATAQKYAVARGVHIASRVPTGYLRRAKEAGGTGRLELDPKAAPVIHELFTRRTGGAGWTELAQFLDESGISGPYGNRAWTPSVVRNIITNRVYLGEARSGQHVNSKAHEPIVTPLEWEAAQPNGHSLSIARSGEGALLAGLVRCAGCRYIVKPDTMRDRDRSQLRVYTCRGRHAAGRCPNPATIMGRRLEPWVEGEFLAALGADGVLAEATEDTTAIDEALRELEEAEHDLALYRDEPGIQRVLGNEHFVQGLEARKRAVDAARERIADARQRSALAEAFSLTPGNLADAWPTLSVSERRRLLTAAIDCIFVRSAPGRRTVSVEDRAIILWRGTAPVDLPRRGLRVPLTSFPWPDG
jgi:site-specific DNA recombinase